MKNKEINPSLSIEEIQDLGILAYEQYLTSNHFEWSYFAHEKLQPYNVTSKVMVKEMFLKLQRHLNKHFKK